MKTLRLGESAPTLECLAERLVMMDIATKQIAANTGRMIQLLEEIRDTLEGLRDDLCKNQG